MGGKKKKIITDNHPKQELWDSRPKLSAKIRCEIAVLCETDHENNHESTISVNAYNQS